MLTQEQFRDEVLKTLTTQHPRIQIKEVLPSGARVVQASGLEAVLFFENPYNAYTGAPHQLSEIINDYLRRMIQEAPEASRFGAPLAAVGSHLYPMLRPASYLATAEQQLRQAGQWPKGKLAARPLFAGVFVTLAVDRPEQSNRTFVLEQEMIAWGKAFPELERQAFVNLSKMPTKVIKTTVDNVGVVYVVSPEDPYNAARLLLTGLTEDIAKKLGGDLLFAIPQRETLWFCPASDGKTARWMAQWIQQKFGSRSDLLSPRLLLYKPGTQSFSMVDLA